MAAEDSAGNYIESNSSSTENVTGDIARDAYVFSANTIVRDANIGRSLLNLSYSISISNSTIGDSVRSLSESLVISDTTIDNNLTVAARSIEIRGDSTYNAIYGAADNAILGGTTNAINMVGETITISGVVTGDVNLEASNVIIKSTADIQGNLNLTSGHEPVVEDGAKIGKTNFDQVTPEEVHVKTPTEVLTETLIDIAYWTIVTLLIAYLIVIFAGNSVKGAVFDLKYHLLPLILTGLISLILIPVVSIVLILPYITLPITLMISTAYVLIASICVPFAAAVVGRWATPKLNKWVSTLIFALVFGILSRIPYLALILDLLCMILTLGYIVLKLYDNMREAFKRPNPVEGDVDHREEIQRPTEHRDEVPRTIDRDEVPQDRA